MGSSLNIDNEHNVQFEDDHLFYLPPSKAQEGITTLPLPFYDDDLSHVSDSYEENQDQHDLGIEVEPHEILDPDPTTIPNQRPKSRWDKNIIASSRDGARNREDIRRTRSQFQNEHVALSHIDSFSIEWFSKFLGKS